MIAGIRSYFSAHEFIRKHKLWNWVIWPGLIYCLLFGLGLYYIWVFSDLFTARLSAYFGIQRWVQDLESVWVSFFFILLALAIRLVFLVYYFACFKYIFLILGTPVFVYLAERTRSLLEKRPMNLESSRFSREIKRGIRISLQNWLVQTLATLGLFLLSFIPVLGWVSPLGAMLMECYFLGFSMMDYSNAQQGMSLRQSMRMVREHRGLAIGNGLVFYLLHLLVLVGWVLAPSYSVIASSIRLHESRLI